MIKKHALVVTHIVYSKTDKNSVLVGPFTSVCNALYANSFITTTLQLPLDGYRGKIKYGLWGQEKERSAPSFLGAVSIVKYCIDFMITFIYTIAYLFRNRQPIIIGIDPLSCLPLVIIGFFTKYKLIYYCVDFNTKRFANPALQSMYTWAEKWCSKHATQVWAVSERLVEYKKINQNVACKYVPNAPVFNKALLHIKKEIHSNIRVVWGGSCITVKQRKDLFSVIRMVLEFVPSASVTLAPTDQVSIFKKEIRLHEKKRIQVASLSNKEWRSHVAQADVGLAIYDPSFGSSDFIEPLKIWDYMGVGVPFIITGEISLCQDIVQAKVALQLARNNMRDDTKQFVQFFEKKELHAKQKTCIELAKKYDMSKLVGRFLTALL